MKNIKEDKKLVDGLRWLIDSKIKHCKDVWQLIDMAHEYTFMKGYINGIFDLINLLEESKIVSTEDRLDVCAYLSEPLRRLEKLKREQ